MVKKSYLFRQIGFIHTLEILRVHNHGMPLRDFYTELNKKSYYNAFYRVKKRMIELDLIRFTENREIDITVKGILVDGIVRQLIKLT